MLKVSPFDSTFGYIVSPAAFDTGNHGISGDDHAEIKRLYAESGFVLFRGFGFDVDTFGPLVQSFSSEIVRHPNMLRQSVTDDRSILLVDPNETAIPAHSELTYTPLRPEMQWFLCVKSAASGGETTVYDGHAILEALKPATRKTFVDKRLKWKMEQPIPPAVWQALFGIRTADEAIEIFQKFAGFQFRFADDGTLTFQYLTPAIVTSKYTGRLAFANNYLVGGIPLELEDGTAIPSDYRWEILEVSERYAIPISWESGDVAMIDNNRVMHGRRKFKDTTRKIAAMVSNANF